DTVARLAARIGAGKYRHDRGLHLLAVAVESHYDRGILIVLEETEDGVGGAHDLSIEGDNVVADAEPGLGGGHLRIKIADGVRFRGAPARLSAAIVRRGRNDGHTENAVVALDLQIQRLVRAERLFVQHLFPSRVLDAVDAYDAVAALESHLVGGRTFER